jgi:hypothetical protein
VAKELAPTAVLLVPLPLALALNPIAVLKAKSVGKTMLPLALARFPIAVLRPKIPEALALSPVAVLKPAEPLAFALVPVAVFPWGTKMGGGGGFGVGVNAAGEIRGTARYLTLSAGRR